MTATALLIGACGGNDAPSQETKRASTTQSSGQSKPKPAATKAPNDSEQLNELLATRAAALRDGDEAAFLKTSTGSQASKDKRAIANAKELPISDVRMTAEGTEIEGEHGHAARRHDLPLRGHRDVLHQDVPDDGAEDRGRLARRP